MIKAVTSLHVKCFSQINKYGKTSLLLHSYSSSMLLHSYSSSMRLLITKMKLLSSFWVMLWSFETTKLLKWKSLNKKIYFTRIVFQLQLNIENAFTLRILISLKICLWMESLLLPVFSTLTLMLTSNFVILSCLWVVVDWTCTSSAIAGLTTKDDKEDDDWCNFKENVITKIFLMFFFSWKPICAPLSSV